MSLDIDKRINELGEEIENLNKMWLKDVLDVSKDRIDDIKKEKAYRDISDKYMFSIVDKEDELAELEQIKDKGI